MTALLMDFGPEYGQVVGRLHPMVVHFPIALLLVAGAIEFLRFLTRRPGRSESAFTCLWIGALAAAIVAYTGWEYAEHDPPGRSVEDTVFWHRWLAVSTASTAVLAVCFSLMRRGSQLKQLPEKPWVRTAYRLALTLAVGLCAGAGHLGGELVYGEGFLFEPLRLASEAEAGAGTDADGPGETGTQDGGGTGGTAALLPLGGGGAGLAVNASAGAPPAGPVADDPPAPALIDFRTQVQPIFEARCLECHGERKQKGKLRLDSREAVFGVAPSKRVILRGSAEKSKLFQLVSLPADDLDIMPGKGDPLTPEQIGILRDWIDQGAKWPTNDDEAAAAPGANTPASTSASEQLANEQAPEPAANDTAAIPDTALVTPIATPIATETETVTAAPHVGDVIPPVLDVPDLDAAATAAAAEAVAKLLEQGVLAGPIATNTDAVEVDFGLLGDAVGDAQLAGLDGLGPRLVWLSLARTAVTDAGLGRVAGFPLLQRLNLAETDIGDAGLAHLTGLAELQTLNLFGTHVSDAGLDHLRGMTSLRKLYLWSTNVTIEGVEALQWDLGECDIDFGADLLPPAESETDDGASEEDGSHDREADQPEPS